MPGDYPHTPKVRLLTAVIGAMDLSPTLPTGSFLATLIDQDIAHIGRVMNAALRGDLGGPILPAAYWRKRLNELLDVDHLTKTQLYAIDGLLLQLDQYDHNGAAHGTQIELHDEFLGDLHGGDAAWGAARDTLAPAGR